MRHIWLKASLRNTFANSRLNNSIVNDLESESLNSVDASYIFDPKTESRLTAYYALLKMQLKFLFLCRRDFDDGAGYLSTDALWVKRWHNWTKISEENWV
jgi:hypothetical protein